jgi:regulation of enolase protein 1 (concanavalin A-like superfamily)
MVTEKMKWIREPKNYRIKPDRIEITTERYRLFCDLRPV